jgi:hypothetical protein
MLPILLQIHYVIGKHCVIHAFFVPIGGYVAYVMCPSYVSYIFIIWIVVDGGPPNYR